MLVVLAMLSLPCVMPIALVVGLTIALVVAAVVVTVVLAMAKLGCAMATGCPGADMAVGPSKLGGRTGADGLLGGSDDCVPYSTHWIRWVGNSLKCWIRVTCWQYCGYSFNLPLNLSRAAAPKWNMLESVGLRRASNTNLRARPSLTMVTRLCSMMPPKSWAVIRSSLSGYWGKNLYSSNRFLIMQLKTSCSLWTPEV